MCKQNDRSKRRQLLLRLPGIGSFIEISSDYASEGAVEYFEKIAPARYWLKSLGWPILISILLAAIPYPCGCMPISFKIEAKAHDLALSLIPSLLGFGIGVYALIFGLSGDLLKKLQDGYVKKELDSGVPAASAMSINSAFAFPLVTMLVTIIVASIDKILSGIQLLSTATWFLTFFCLVLTYQLIASLYILGRAVILDKF
ncbi:hypothetical protein [Hydrogenophaga sp. NH-16]|uniref:hypothetical protein n=1 Tax=Hydrogenophaga sp. NH-16 TaxID=2184519 RepID=UPI000FDA166A|nr:hypothetical protein [Hydrogenophaga sp. NH-16]